MLRFITRHRMGGLTLVALLAALLMAASPMSGQTERGGVGVLVQLGDGTVLTRYLELRTPVDRLTVLEESGLSFETAYGGDAVCKIEEEGCRGTDDECWCQCTFTEGEACFFWIYLPMSEDGSGWGDMNVWPLPELDAGDVSAWVWGEVDISSTPWKPLAEAPFLTVEEIQARALTPGVVAATGAKQELDVAASFTGDSDGTGSATARYRRVGTPWSDPQPMIPGEASFGFVAGGLEPGDYEVEVTYVDYVGGLTVEAGSTSYVAPVAQTVVTGGEQRAQVTTEQPADEEQIANPIASTLSGYAAGISLGGLAFVAVLLVLLVVYLRKRPQ